MGLTIVSNNVLGDSIAALGLMIGFYYGLTGLACVIYFRRELLKSARNFFYIGVLPFLGFLSLGYLFIKSCIELGKKDAGSTVIFGVGGPARDRARRAGDRALSSWRCRTGTSPEFFKRKREVADPDAADRRRSAAHAGHSLT